MPAPTPASDFGTSSNDGRRRWLTPDAPVEAPREEAAPARKPGGTLFERMANAGRAPARGTDDAKEPLDIPRFLHRQNNQ